MLKGGLCTAKSTCLDMTVKRITAIILILVLVLALIGCRGKNDPNVPANNTEAPAADKTESAGGQGDPEATQETAGDNGAEDQPEATGQTGTNDPESTEAAEPSEGASEGGSAIDDDGDIIITVPDDEDSGGM